MLRRQKPLFVCLCWPAERAQAPISGFGLMGPSRTARKRRQVLTYIYNTHQHRSLETRRLQAAAASYTNTTSITADANDGPEIGSLPPHNHPAGACHCIIGVYERLATSKREQKKGRARLSWTFNPQRWSKVCATALSGPLAGFPHPKRQERYGTTASKETVYARAEHGSS